MTTPLTIASGQPADGNKRKRLRHSTALELQALDNLALGAYIKLEPKAWYQRPELSLRNDDTMLAGILEVTIEHWLLVKEQLLSLGFVGTEGDRLYFIRPYFRRAKGRRP